MAGFSPVAGRQDGHEQVRVALLAGRGGLGGPDRVQNGQVVGVGQGLVPGLGGGALLAVMVQHAGQHGQAGVHGAALGGVVGDGVAQLGLGVTGVQKGPAGPPAL